MSTNRKRKYFCKTIDVNGEDIPINIGSNKGGVFYEIIQRGIEQLDIAIQIHKRVSNHWDMPMRTPHFPYQYE